jgi:hypothetical protein
MLMQSANTFVSFPFLHSLPHHEAGSQSQHDRFLLVQHPFLTTKIGDHLGTHSDIRHILVLLEVHNLRYTMTPTKWIHTCSVIVHNLRYTMTPTKWIHTCLLKVHNLQYTMTPTKWIHTCLLKCTTYGIPWHQPNEYIPVCSSAQLTVYHDTNQMNTYLFAKVHNLQYSMTPAKWIHTCLLKCTTYSIPWHQPNEYIPVC